MKLRFICYTDAMIRLQGDKVLFLNLLKKFSESYGEYINEIESLINSSDYMEAYEVTHLIKGTAANLSMKNLEFVSDKLCYALSNADKIDIEVYLSNFKREFMCVLDEVKEYLSVGGSLWRMFYFC